MEKVRYNESRSKGNFIGLRSKRQVQWEREPKEQDRMRQGPTELKGKGTYTLSRTKLKQGNSRTENG